METPYIPLSTGVPALDRVLQNIMPGDNIVWQIDSIDEYVPFIKPFAENAVKTGKRLVYFRFSSHPELLGDNTGAEIYRVDPRTGFETAASEVHKIMAQADRGTCFVFDCLSDLADIWCSDLMLGNFFILTCPYVYNMDSLAYFAFIRNRHSLHVAASIRDTTQIFLDVYRHKGNLYVHPMKVWQRHSPTMYMPHIWEREDFRPVTDSAAVSEVVSAVMGSRLDSASRIVDMWDRTFILAEETLEAVNNGEKQEKDAEEIFRRIMKMIFSRDENILRLASKYLHLADILAIRKRLVGTGLIGGKADGMIIARAILVKTDERWKDTLEVHDSFYIGSDVFYTYIVRNGMWRVRQKQRNFRTFLDDIDDSRQRMLGGEFPEFITNQFIEMLDYFGQSPIIVRSSSLLEDNFGNAFSGKYESVFCVNQGTRRERLKAFLSAVRRVYASTMSYEALMYRYRRGLLDSDEQMGLLVQRVSGAVYGSLFFPQIAGVGFSFNPYAWSDKIRPEAGMLRLVCGLGTRAVERHDDDYTRIVALNAPELRPEENFDKVKRFAQRKADVLDLHINKFASVNFEDLNPAEGNFPIDIIATRGNGNKTGAPGEKNDADSPWIPTFQQLLSGTSFVNTMQEMLKTLQSAYNYPVEIEFTTNFTSEGTYQINLVQCRPFQIMGMSRIVSEIDKPDAIKRDDILLEVHGTIIGPGMASEIDRIIYVVPSVYGEMPERDRYSVARLIGRVTHHKRGGDKILMLIGPGRWGTSMSMLGVPVRFAEINTVSVLCELVEMNENLVPEVSLGTHFFNDIVEFKMLYLAVFPNVRNNFLNRRILESAPNRLGALVPDQENLSDAVRVIDIKDIVENRKLFIYANAVDQKALCYFTDI
ncbi:PEP/pyruvate-binding domain-containing protein [bacterium]|nr:PEP/pyruvate-binding domain-containing protein [bacterium]